MAYVDNEDVVGTFHKGVVGRVGRDIGVGTGRDGFVNQRTARAATQGHAPDSLVGRHGRAPCHRRAACILDEGDEGGRCQRGGEVADGSETGPGVVGALVEHGDVGEPEASRQFGRHSAWSAVDGSVA